ncbi:MAG: aminotransferase class IV [Pseudomonadota bacterium]|nr:aminotransferase class IV [Pseudomonadota bacterium]MEE2821260.1 aminotransferase class IV [Pseudomonadota bacterium]
MPIEQATISPMDRGFLFGDGVYEVMARVGGRIRAKSLHQERLQSSLDAIGLSVLVDDVFTDVDRLTEKAGLSDAKIYIQVTRGAASARDHAFPSKISPTVFLTISEFAAVSQKPATAIVRPDIRWRRNSIKSVSLLGNVLLMQEARESGAQEAILYHDNMVTEASTSNVFVIRSRCLITPPLSDLILPGITRHLVIEMASTVGLDVVEEPIRIDSLPDADGVFVSSSTRGLMPIVELDPGGQVGGGQLTQVFMALQAAYDKRLHHHE